MDAQLPIELLPPFFRKEYPRPTEANVRPHAGDRRREPIAPFPLEVDVVRPPRDERRRRQLPQLRLDGDRVRRIERGQETLEVARPLRASQVRRQIEIDRFVR